MFLAGDAEGRFWKDRTIAEAVHGMGERHWQRDRIMNYCSNFLSVNQITDDHSYLRDCCMYAHVIPSCPIGSVELLEHRACIGHQ